MTDPRTSPRPAERANTFPWPPVIFIGAIAAALLMTEAWPLPWPGLDDALAHGIGLAFGAIGLVLIVFAFRALRAHGTTVLPDQTATTLVTSGPYARFRNPMYLGAVLVLFAAAEVTKSIWFVAAGFAFAVLVTALQILPEEHHLESQFGDAYLDYKSRTRRWI
jgi:protein-S-isoprenylcysteine O-methyltransferase Ste14